MLYYITESGGEAVRYSELEKELITTDRRELQELLKRNGKIERV